MELTLTQILIGLGITTGVPTTGWALLSLIPKRYLCKISRSIFGFGTKWLIALFGKIKNESMSDTILSMLREGIDESDKILESKKPEGEK